MKVVYTKVVYTFRSISTPSRRYQTIDYQTIDYAYKREVRTLTCNCMGWARRVQPDGNRMCVHTRLVLAGNPEKDPCFISRDPPLAPELPSFPYPTQSPIGVTNGEEIAAKLKAYFDSIWKSETPWVDIAQSRRVTVWRFPSNAPGWASGNDGDFIFCTACDAYHFPEYVNCKKRLKTKLQTWDDVLRDIGAEPIEAKPSKPKPKAKPEPPPLIAKPNKRKFNFDA